MRNSVECVEALVDLSPYRDADETEQFQLITKSRAKEQFLLKDVDIDKREPTLKFILKQNPHNGTWGSMKLYLHCQVIPRLLRKWEIVLTAIYPLLCHVYHVYLAICLASNDYSWRFSTCHTPCLSFTVSHHQFLHFSVPIYGLPMAYPQWLMEWCVGCLTLTRQPLNGSWSGVLVVLHSRDSPSMAHGVVCWLSYIHETAPQWLMEWCAGCLTLMRQLFNGSWSGVLVVLHS